MKYLQGQHILILGLGSSGLAMARWCAEMGADVTVADTREAPANLQILKNDLPDVQFISGAFAAHLIEGTSVRAVFASPGLAPAETAPVIEAAKAMGLWVGGELSLFVQALENLKATKDYAPQVLAITGTNGKTTVTALTGLLIERAGKTVKVAGNIGPTLLDTLRLSMATELPEVWVLELSSFQLDNAGPFEPSAATVLNITQDHLDWHGNMAAYAAAKEKIFGAHSLWFEWLRNIAPDNQMELQALEADGGRYLTYNRVVARRRPNVKLEEPMVSIPSHYTRNPLLRSHS